MALKVVLLNLSWGQIEVGPSWLSLLQAEIKMSKDAPLSKVIFSSKHKMHQIQRTTSVQIQVYSYLLNPTRLKMKFKMRDKIQMQEQSKSNLWNTAQVKMETQAFPGAAHSEMFILFKLFQRKCDSASTYLCMCKKYKLCVGQTTTTTFLETIHEQTFKTVCACWKVGSWHFSRFAMLSNLAGLSVSMCGCGWLDWSSLFSSWH